MAHPNRTTPDPVFDPLLERFEGPLVRYAARITGDLERARDVVQETFLTLHKETANRTGLVAANGHLAAWLFTVCRRKALDIRRKEQRMTTLTAEQADLCVTSDEPPGDLEQRETSGQLLELLNALSEQQQEVVRLKFQNGLSYREISEVTGLTVTNVGYILHTSINKLRKMLNKE